MSENEWEAPQIIGGVCLKCYAPINASDCCWNTAAALGSEHVPGDLRPLSSLLVALPGHRPLWPSLQWPAREPTRLSHAPKPTPLINSCLACPTVLWHFPVLWSHSGCCTMRSPGFALAFLTMPLVVLGDSEGEHLDPAHLEFYPSRIYPPLQLPLLPVKLCHWGVSLGEGDVGVLDRRGGAPLLHGAQREPRLLSLISVPCPLSTGTWCYDSQDPKCGEDRVSCEAIWDQSLSCGH